MVAATKRLLQFSSRLLSLDRYCVSGDAMDKRDLRYLAPLTLKSAKKNGDAEKCAAPWHAEKDLAEAARTVQIGCVFASLFAHYHG
jgi:hypothetical protein